MVYHDGLQPLAVSVTLFGPQTFYGIFGVFMCPDLATASVLSAMSYGALQAYLQYAQ